jgi:hypothetical protein
VHVAVNLKARPEEWARHCAAGTSLEYGNE